MRRASPGALLLPPLLALLSARGAAAQRARASLDVGGTGVQLADSVDVTALALSPALRLAWPQALLAASGTWSQLAGGGWTTQGALEAAAFTPARGALSAELAGALGGSAHEDGTRTSQTLALLRLHADAPRLGAWAGGGVGRTWNGFEWRTLTLGEGGVWARAEGPRGAATLSAAAAPTMVDDSLRYLDLSAQGRWETPRLELLANVGARAGATLPEYGGARRVWGGAQVVAWVAGGAAVVAGAGTYPVDPTQGYPGGRFVTLGLRLATRDPARRSPAPAPVDPPAPARTTAPREEVTLLPAAGGRRTVRVLAPAAARVELMGDFTDWTPVRMTAAGGGWWVATLPITRGAHQMNVRLDGGAWRVPAGLPVVRDEFGGTVGVLAVP